MMNGTVNDLHEAVLRLSVRGPKGEREVEAVVDTGFDGALTLPSYLVAELGLPFLIEGKSLLGDGTLITFDTHVGIVLWNGQPRRVWVEVADIEPLLGTRLLLGSELRIEFVEGGAVAVLELRAS